MNIQLVQAMGQFQSFRKKIGLIVIATTADIPIDLLQTNNIGRFRCEYLGDTFTTIKAITPPIPGVSGGALKLIELYSGA